MRPKAFLKISLGRWFDYELPVQKSAANTSSQAERGCGPQILHTCDIWIRPLSAVRSATGKVPPRADRAFFRRVRRRACDRGGVHAHIVRPMRASHAPEGSPDCTVAHRMPRRKPRTVQFRIVRPMRVSPTAHSDPGRVNSLPHPPHREVARLSLRWQRARAGNPQTKARLP